MTARNGRFLSFRHTVYRFYRRHARDLPWRHTSDPYHIFVSEVMLQQTQVHRVAAAFERFIGAFPTWQSLADARLDSVLTVWRGMGYNRRARYLREAARIVVGDYGGNLPSDPQLLGQLPGIGKATAASIAVFAFNKPVVFIETNIRSVFIHHFFDDRLAVGDDEILSLVEQALDHRNPRRWYSALMDYGTMLKKKTGNPSRRSRHYQRQPRFEGSMRQIRGELIRTLLAHPGRTGAWLRRVNLDEDGRVFAALAAMRTEGLVSCRNGRYRIAHE